MDIILVFLDSFLRHFEHDKKYGFFYNVRIVFEGVGFLRNFDPGREESIVGLQWFEIYDFATVGLVLLLLSYVGWDVPCAARQGEVGFDCTLLPTMMLVIRHSSGNST